MIKKCVHEKCKTFFWKKNNRNEKMANAFNNTSTKILASNVTYVTFEMIVNKLLVKIDEKEKYSNYESV